MMTLTIHLGSLQAEQLAFNYSPVHEAVHSLCVLTRSGRHPLHLPWVRSIRQQMPPALKAEVSAFGILFAAAIPDIFADSLLFTTDSPTFDEEFRMMQALSPHDYAELVTNQSIMGREVAFSFEQVRQSREMQQQVLARTTDLHPASLEMVEELLTHPEQSHKRFLRFFSWYWEVCLAPEWPQLEDLLLQDIQHRGQILFEQGVLEILDSLAPQLNVYRQNENITARYPSQNQREMRVDNLLFLLPSSYVWPRLLYIYENDVLKAIAYSIKRFHEEGNAPVPPERLFKLLRAVGDMTRLQILQLLSQQPRSTRELAGILGLTEAGISKHLKILQDAGFLRSERSSYYVLYQNVRDPLVEITHGLDRILQSPSHL
jgi:DNA-binding transcriptional ArsR family regulator